MTPEQHEDDHRWVFTQKELSRLKDERRVKNRAARRRELVLLIRGLLVGAVFEALKYLLERWH